MHASYPWLMLDPVLFNIHCISSVCIPFRPRLNIANLVSSRAWFALRWATNALLHVERGQHPVRKDRLNKLARVPRSGCLRTALPSADSLSSRSVRESGLWQVDVIERALEAHRRGECAIGARLFDVAQLCMWLEGSRRWPLESRHRPARDEQLAVA